jgi:hypothetical protein
MPSEFPDEVWAKIKEAGGLDDTRRSKIAQAMDDYRSDIRRNTISRETKDSIPPIKGTADKLHGLIKSIYAKDEFLFAGIGENESGPDIRLLERIARDLDDLDVELQRAESRFEKVGSGGRIRALKLLTTKVLVVQCDALNRLPPTSPTETVEGPRFRAFVIECIRQATGGAVTDAEVSNAIDQAIREVHRYGQEDWEELNWW